MRTASLSVSLTIGLVTACAPAHVVTTPAPTPIAGSPIRFAGRPDSTEFVTARLISLDAETLVFERFIARHPAGRWVAESLPTDSITQLQVRVGRRGNAGRGALIGGLAGVVLGIACASEEPGWLTPTPAECLAGYTLSGVGTGLLIGLLIRSDVWAPATLPPDLEQPPVAAATAAVGMGLRIPVRLGGP